jgi:hypothetical protein
MILTVYFSSSSQIQQQLRDSHASNHRVVASDGVFRCLVHKVQLMGAGGLRNSAGYQQVGLIYIVLIKFLLCFTSLF